MSITRHTVAASAAVQPYWRPTGDPVWGDGVQGPLLWSGSPNLTTSRVLAAGRYVVRLAFTGDVLVYAQRVTTATLEAGKSYQVVAHVSATTSGMTARVGLSPGAAGPAYPVEPRLSAGLTEITATVTVSAAGVGVVTITAGNLDNPAGSGTIDVHDVAVYEATQTAAVDLRPDSVEVVLDSEWSPYARATLVCPIPTPAALEQLDPRGVDRFGMPRPQVRAKVTLTGTDRDSQTAADLTEQLHAAGTTTAAQWTTALAGLTAADLTDQLSDPYNATGDPALTTTRSLDLHLRSRVADYVAGTMRVELAGDEAYLQDFKRYDTSTASWTPPTTTSLRALVGWALGLYGWTLQAGDDVVIDSSKIVWNLGESLWSFLDAFVRGSGKRLWCDELRRWWLTDSTPTAAGTARIDGPTHFVDTLSRDDDAYGDAAVLAYEWVDPAGAQQRQYAFTYTSGLTYPKTVVQRFADQQPVPGASGTGVARLRSRAMSRGRAMALRAVSDYSVTPGQAAVVTTPVTTVAGALVSAVRWSLPDDEMDVVTRDVVA